MRLFRYLEQKSDISFGPSHPTRLYALFTVFMLVWYNAFLQSRHNQSLVIIVIETIWLSAYSV